MVINMQKVEENEIEVIISQMMIDLGIPAHLKGYHYMRSAVMMAVQDMRVVGSVTKLLYPEIARQYGTTNGKVERAIRNAIEISWERGNRHTFDRMFGYCMESGQGRPTNSEYIAAIADAVCVRMKEAAS